MGAKSRTSWHQRRSSRWIRFARRSRCCSGMRVVSRTGTGIPAFSGGVAPGTGFCTCTNSSRTWNIANPWFYPLGSDGPPSFHRPLKALFYQPQSLSEQNLLQNLLFITFCLFPRPGLVLGFSCLQHRQRTFSLRL